MTASFVGGSRRFSLRRTRGVVAWPMTTPPEVLLVVTQTAPQCAVRPGLTLAWDTAEPAVLGRSPACELCLADPTVSRRHARFVRLGQSFLVEGLAHGNGMFIDDGLVAAGDQRVLRPGQTLQVGGVVLELQVLEATAAVLQPLSVVGPAPESERIALDVSWDGGHCAVMLQGQLLALPPLAAKALGLLAESSGVVVHKWDLLDQLGAGTNLAQVFSLVRSAFLSAVEAEALALSTVREHVARHSSVVVDELDAKSVMRHFIASRRGHGYRICLSADEVTVRHL